MAYNRGFPVQGDLRLTDDGTELVLISGAEMAIQQVKSGAEIWTGTLAWDPDAGLPMLNQILVKGPDLRVIQGIFRDFLLDTAGVASVDELSVDLDRAARRLDVRFKVTAEDGSDAADSISFTFA